jgi:RNA recognition motif-containing protein
MFCISGVTRRPPLPGPVDGPMVLEVVSPVVWRVSGVNESQTLQLIEKSPLMSTCSNKAFTTCAMSSSTFRILSLLRGNTRTVHPFSRSFLRELRPFSTAQDVPAAEDHSNDVGDDDNTTIFVGRLPSGLGRWQIRRKLREMFDPFGRVLSVRVGESSCPTDSSVHQKVITFSATDFKGSNRDFAHIIYARRKNALAAVRAGNDNTRFVLSGRNLNVDLASGARKPDTDVRRKLNFRGFSGNQLMLRKALSKGLARHVQGIGRESMELSPIILHS